MKGTTVLAVKKGPDVVLIADGQVTYNDTVIKHGARKLRRLHTGQVLAGFAGATADAFSLCERFEGKLKDYGGNLLRAAVELAKDWRTDKLLRKLEAMLLVADADTILLLTGTGDVIEPDDDVSAIGSGGPYAAAAARALLKHTDLSAEQVAQAAMEIAASLCIYTNDRFLIERVSRPDGDKDHRKGRHGRNPAAGTTPN